MIYYTETKYYNQENLNNSLKKGRDDYFEVLRRMGFTPLRIPSLKPNRFISAAERLKTEIRLTFAWNKALAKLGEEDILIIHSPNSEKLALFGTLIKRAHSKGCRIVTIVFELESFFNMDYRRFGRLKRFISVMIERSLFNISDAMVVHNDVMKSRLESVGVDGNKMFSVGIMDYLRDEALTDDHDGRISKDLPVIYAGDLAPEKSSFEYILPEGFRCNLYGPNYAGKDSENICYKGVFPALQLMDVMSGSFGLVWEGASVDTCSGPYGEYLTFNNPHKIALYLASGFPVAVWSGAAMADFVRREGCGIIIGSLRDLPEVISSMSASEYEEMCNNARHIGKEMRNGVHIRQAVQSAIDYL